MKKPDRQKMTFRIDAHLARQLSGRARTRRVSQTEVLEAALASMLTPDSDERIEAVVTKRLDRLARQLERLEWHVELSNEAFAIFVRFWLTSNAPLPDEAMRAAQATGKQRYQAFVESLAKRMDAGPKLRDEIDS